MALEMKARCNRCGEEFDMEYMGLGMFEGSQAMKDHETTHTERVIWHYMAMDNVARPADEVKIAIGRETLEEL